MDDSYGFTLFCRFLIVVGVGAICYQQGKRKALEDIEKSRKEDEFAELKKQFLELKK